MLDRIVVPNVQLAARQSIKEFILESDLREGDRLPTEEDLAKRLGVSRTAVREALRGLEALGIIHSRRGSGRYVRKFNFEVILDNLAYSLFYDMHTFEELLHVREKLEASFLEETIKVVTPETLSHLQAILLDMETKFAQESSTEEVTNEHLAFHRTLYEPVGNSLLLKLLDIFWVVHQKLSSKLPGEAEDPEQYTYQHQALLDAIASRDVALAQARLIEHFKGVRQWIAMQKSADDADNTTGGSTQA